VRHIRKRLLSKPNNFRILGLSLSSSGFDSHKKAGPFSSGFSHLSTIAAPISLITITLDFSEIWQAGPSVYKETNPQNLTNVGGAEQTYPCWEPCEENGELSRQGRQGRKSLR
jgi:hypothetical protein